MRGPSPTAARSGWARCGRPRRSPATLGDPTADEPRRAATSGPGELRASALARRLLRVTTTAAGASSDSVMADQLAGQWYADVTGLGDLVQPARVEARSAHDPRAQRAGASPTGRSGPVNGTRPDGSVDRSSEQSQEVWVGTAYALAAFMIGRGLARPRAGRRRPGHRPGDLRARPLVPDARGVRRAGRLTGRRCTCGRWRSGRSRRPSGGSGSARRRVDGRRCGAGRPTAG